MFSLVVWICKTLLSSTTTLRLGRKHTFIVLEEQREQGKKEKRKKDMEKTEFFFLVIFFFPVMFWAFGQSWLVGVT
jgi:nitrate reductase NapE component